jgi:hypothetical protein
MIDIRHRADRRVGESKEGGHRSAPAFEAEGRDRDRMFAVVDERLGENRAGENSALATSSVNAHFVHRLAPKFGEIELIPRRASSLISINVSSDHVLPVCVDEWR